MKTREEYLERILVTLRVMLFVLAAIFGLLLGTTLNAQMREKPLPAVYLSHQITDLGFGARGDYHITPWAGVYGSATYGQWRLYKWSGLDKHVKLTGGILIPLGDWNGNQHDISIGGNWHWVSGEVQPSEVYKDAKIFHKPWSFELGLTIKYPRVALAFRTDILRWEPCVDVGIIIGKRSMQSKINMIGR